MQLRPWLLGLLLAAASCHAVAAEKSLGALVRTGERDVALTLIRGGADVNATEGDGSTPLHWAVYRIDTVLVEELLRRGANPNAVNRYGSSPLAEAVKIGDVRLVRMLLDAGADVEAPNADRQTALMLAARAGALDVVELLVERGADVNTREEWRSQTALMWAADENQPEIVRFLIEHGADVHVRANFNDWETQITSEPRAQYRPTGGLTALAYAARSGCVDCIAAILDAGADIDRPNPDGVTPLMIAIDNYRFDAAKLLIERGANPHVWDWWGRTALYVAVDMASFPARAGGPSPEGQRTTAHDIVRLLLEAGVNPNSQLNMHRPSRGGNMGRFVDDLLTTGATPLLLAAIGHDIESIELLLAHGALVDLPNVMGVTPLMAAAGMGISPRDRRTEFDDGVQERAIATIDVLLEAGADLHARVTDIHSRTARIARLSTMTEREGQTALFGAVRFGWDRVVAHLLAKGARPDVVDALGKTPLDGAEGRIGGRDNTPSPAVAELLRKALAGEA